MIGVDVEFEPSAGEVIAATGVLPRKTVIAAVPVPNEFAQATVIVLAPLTSATELVEVLVEALPFTVQVLPAGMLVPPLTVYATLIDAFVVLSLLAGAVIATVGTTPLTVIESLSLPNALVQTSVIVFAPVTRFTVAGEVAAEPFTVQVIGVEPVLVQTSDVVAAVVLLLLAGDVMLLTGTVPRVTFTAALFEPNAFEQATVIVLLPTARLTELVEVLVELAPLTVQVVPAGIEVPPLTVYAALIDALVVSVPLAGAVTATVGATPLTVTVAVLPGPNELVHWTLIVFGPATIAREFVVAEVELEPFTVQVVPAGIVVEPLTV